ncbi:MAG: T9SS type A sorting domain-containing protein [Ignavibacteriales bacterium]|nr:T9SS type A sorting domain-containing protein [Ignavibacteriales bacterium]
MAQKFSGASPAGIWIVSLYQDNGVTQMNFPGNGTSYPYIQFISTDQNEVYLSRFDSAGVNIWLQVEPGAASMDTLITLVLGRYKQHPCVKGFGVDVEWFYANTSSGGRRVTDAEALAWEARVKSFDPAYSLFLKHYATSWMPPTYRGSILFVDDSQQFPSLNSMVSEFKAWGSKFSQNNVAFQFGYKIDTTWWKQYADPPLTIGSALRSAVPNCTGLFWVDFTITTVFPPTSVQETPFDGPLTFELSQNYPNPFNPTTSFEFRIPGFPAKGGSASGGEFVTLKIYDVLGREIATLVNEARPAGVYNVRWDASSFSSGVYFYRLHAGDFVETKTMVLMK